MGPEIGHHMKKKSVILILFAILILAACVPPTAPSIIEASHIATSSPPSAIELGTLGHGSAKTAAWSVNGKILAVGSTRGIYLYDTTTWQMLKFIEMQDDADYRNGVLDLWFHPDGKSLYYTRVATPYLLIYRYDLMSGESKHLYQGIAFSERTTIIFSPDGGTFANMGATILDEKGEPKLLPNIEIREVATGKLLQTLNSQMEWWGSFQSGLASFSSDGTLFATGGADNIVRVWDVNNSALLFKQKHDADIRSLAFSPDGKMLASTGNDATVRFWDSHTGESLFLLRKFEHGLVYLAYSMSGRELLLGTSNGSYQRWAVDEHFLPVARENSDFKPDRYIYTKIPASQFISSDGSRLAVVDDANLQIFNLAEANQSVTLSEFNSELTSIKFSPNGNLLALIGHDVHLWDVNSHTALRTLRPDSYEVSDVAFSPNGKQIAVASGSLQIWDLSTFQKMIKIDEIMGQVAYSPDSLLLATGGWYDVTIRNSDNGRPKRSFKITLGVPYALSFSTDGKRLMFIAEKGIRVWDVASGNLLQSLNLENFRLDHAVFYSANHALMEDFVSCMDGGKLNFWDFESGQPLYSLIVPMCGLGYSAIHPSERLLAHVSGFNESSEIYLSDTLSGQSLLTLSFPKKRMESLSFSPNGKILAAEEANDAVIHLWDISSVARLAESSPAMTATPLPTETPTPSPTPALANEIPLPLVTTPQAPSPNAITVNNVDHLAQIGALGGSLYNSSPYTAAWSSDGKQFAVGNLGAVYVYKTGTAFPWRSFAGGNLVENLLFSPDDRYLAEQNNKDEVIVWDLITGKRAYTFERDCWGSSLNFNMNSKTLTIDCPGETTRMFDLENGRLISQKESGRYGNPSPDGRLLVSNDSYNAYLMDAQSGNILHVFETGASSWRSSFSPDGQTLLIWNFNVPVEKIVRGEKQTDYESIVELWHVLVGQEPVLRQTIFIGTANMESPPVGETYAFNSDGKYLITTIWDGFVRIWDTNTGKLLSELKGGNQVFLSADDKRLITLESSGHIKIWDLTSVRKPKQIQTITDFEVQSYTCPISFTNDGKEIAVSAGMSVEKWNVTEQLINPKATSYKLENRTRAFAASLDGTHWATDNPDGSVDLRDPKTGKILHTLTGNSLPLSEYSSSVAIEQLLFSDAGNILVAINSWNAWFWDVKAGTLIQHIKPDFPIADLALSPDGRLLAFSENNDGKADIWDTQTGKRLRRFDFAGYQIAFSPDESILATGWRNGRVSLLDIRSGQTVRTLQTDDILWDIAFSPDGNLLAVDTSNGVEFWDVKQGRRLYLVDMFAPCMAFSPDGTIFATYGMGDRIRLWSVKGK